LSSSSKIPAPPTVFIKGIPPDISSEQLFSILNKDNNIKRFIVSDVSPAKSYTRVAWAECETTEACEALVTAFNGHKVRSINATIYFDANIGK